MRVRTERLQDARGRLRQEGVKGDGDGAEPIDEVVEDTVERVRLRLVLRELPRCGCLDVAVQPAYDLPDPLCRRRDVEGVEERRNVCPEWVEQGLDGRVVARDRRQRTGPVARDHGRRSRQEVAEVVAELAL